MEVGIEFNEYHTRFKAYASKTKPRHLRMQMAAWNRKRDLNTLQMVLCCSLGNLSDVWTELKDVI